MPTSTFFNLSKEKQNNILKAAKKEFIRNSFYDASINKIVKEAGISRGSFYLYFENKEDLFIYIMNGYKDKMLESISPHIDREKDDIFDLVLLIFDYITKEEYDEDGKKLLFVTMTKLDMELIKNCVNLRESKEEIIILKRFTNVDKLNIKTDEELFYIMEVAFSSLIIEMIYIFSKKHDAVQGRKNLERKFQLIKKGVSK